MYYFGSFLSNNMDKKSSAQNTSNLLH